MADDVAATGKAAPGREALKWDRVVIEVATRKNDTVVFYPAQERLRGRWRNSNLGFGSQPSEALMRMPDIPGIHVFVEVRDRRVGFRDPLAYKENARVLEEASAAHKAMDSDGRPIVPVPDVVKDEVEDTEIATWLYWMMRLVQAEYAVLIKGSLPKDEAEIHRAFPGATVRKTFRDSKKVEA